MKNKVIRIGLAITCVSTLAAQDAPIWRQGRPTLTSYRTAFADGQGGLTEESGFLWMDESSSTLNWTILYPRDTLIEDPDTPDAFLPFMPLDRPGSIIQVNGDQFLVSGYKESEGRGYISEFRLDRDPQLLTMISSIALAPNIDPYDIVYDGISAQIFLLDPIGQQIMVADWSRTQPLGTASTFATIFDKTMLSELDLALAYELRSVAPPQTGVWFSFLAAAGNIPSRIHREGGDWVVEHPLASGSIQGYALSGYREVNALVPLNVYGPGGGYEVQDVNSGQVVLQGTASHTQPGWFSIPVPNGALTPGVAYQVRGVGGGGESTVFRPMEIYGVANEEEGFSLIANSLSPTNLYVGSDSVTARCTVSIGSHLETTEYPFTVDVFLWTALERADGSAPVLGGPDQMFIDPLSVTVHASQPLTFKSTAEHYWPIFYSLPVPNSPSLAGKRIYFQLVAVAPNGFGAISRVVSSAVFPDNSGILEVTEGLQGPTGSITSAADEINARNWKGTSELSSSEQAKQYKMIMKLLRMHNPR